MRLLGAGLLGVAAALLVACGSASDKLIPLANAGPLTSDVEAIEQAAKSGDGDCVATEAAIAKAERDYAALPSTLDAGLRNTLHQGIDNLRTRALALCTQPLATTSTTRTSGELPDTTTTTTTTPPTTTVPSTTTPSTTPTTTSPGGGTPAEGAVEGTPGGGTGEQGAGEQGAGVGGGTGAGGSANGGAGVGAAGGGGAGGGEAPGAGVQEGGK